MQRNFLSIPSIAVVALGVLVSGCGDRDTPAPAKVKRVDPPDAEPAPSDEKKPKPPEPDSRDPKKAEVAPPSPKPPEPAVPSAAERKTLAQLREELVSSTNPDATLKLLDTIGRQRGRAREALPDLLDLTTAGDPRIRWHAARSVGLIGEDAIPAIPSLLKLLQDADPVVATQAAAAVGHIREDDNRTELPEADRDIYQDAVTQLVAALLHDDPRVRRACLRSLRQLDPDPDQIMPIVDEVFAGGDPAVILPALNSIADMGAEAVPFLIERLKRPQGRYWASVALTEIGPAAAAAAPALEEALAESPPEDQLQEILALAAIGEPAREAGDSLISLYADGEPSLRGPLLYALGRLRVSEAEPLLSEVVATESEQLAATAAWARVKLDPENGELTADAIERLVKQCESEEVFARAAAVSALSDLAASAPAGLRQELAGHFGQLLKDPADQVHEAAAAALIRLQGDATGTVVQRLADPVTELPALRIIAAIGEEAGEAVEPVSKRLSAESPELVTEAILALAAIGPQAAAAVDELMPLLDEGEATADAEQSTAVRYAAAYCLGRIGSPAAKPAVERLAALSEADDPLLSTVAIWAALQIEPDNEARFAKAVPRLTQALESESQTVRLEAAIALGDIGDRAEAAVPALELLAEDDPVRDIREAARQALRKIGG